MPELNPHRRPRLDRLIPVLLLHRGGLYKTRRFRSPVYVGDPLNAVRIFSEKGADELVLLDIDASRLRREPDWERLGDIAAQAFMPMAYGGGVHDLRQMERLFRLGYEKVAISAAAFRDPRLFEEGARNFGSQSLVAVVDFRRSWLTGRPKARTHNSTVRVPGDLHDWLQRFQDAGAGEIILNDIDRDGTYSGYDHGLVGECARRLAVPLVALGGARDVPDMVQVIQVSGAAAAAAGSLFVFRSAEGGVLINYPSR